MSDEILGQGKTALDEKAHAQKERERWQRNSRTKQHVKVARLVLQLLLLLPLVPGLALPHKRAQYANCKCGVRNVITQS